MSQREIKAFVDKLNYQDELDSGTRHLIFNVFLINEFKSKDFFLVNKDIKDFPFHIWSLNQFKLPAYFDSFENDYNLKFKNGINNLREYYVDYFENSIKPTDSSPVIMPNVYFPILISFIPIIVQELDFNGIIIDNYDFLMYQSGCEPNNSNYLKYPLVKNSSLYDLNFDVYDITIDPIYCKDSIKSQTKTIEDNLEFINWYYYYHQYFTSVKNETSIGRHFSYKNSIEGEGTSQKVISFKSLKLMFNTQRSSEAEDASKIPTEEYILSIIQVVNLDKTVVPYVSDDYQSSFDYLNFATSITHNYFPQFDMSTEISKSYLKDVYLDDSESIILRIPEFITQNFVYSMLPNTIKSNANNDINIDLMSLNVNILENYEDDYDISIYYKHDMEILKYFNHIVHNRNFLLKLQANSTIALKALSGLNPCPYSNLTDYYIKTVENDYSSECLEQLCSILNCEEDKTLYDIYYVNPNSYYYVPNCLCIPLFCFDDKTTDVPDIIKPIYDIVTKHNKSSIVSKFYNDVVSNLSDPISSDASIIDKSNITQITIAYPFLNEEYFDTSRFEYTYKMISLNSDCRMRFNRKTPDDTSYPYRIQTEIFDQKFDPELKIIRLYFYEEETLENLIKNYKDKLMEIKNYLLIAYGVLVVIICCVIIKWLHMKVDSFRIRISEMKNIHKLIINSDNSKGKISLLQNKAKMIARNMNKDLAYSNANTPQNSQYKKQLTNQITNNYNTANPLSKNSSRINKNNYYGSDNSLDDEYADNSLIEYKNNKFSIIDNGNRSLTENNNIIRNLSNNIDGEIVNNDDNNDNEEEMLDSLVTNNNNYAFIGEIENMRFKDELQEIYSIIIDNIKDFTLEFEIDKNVYVEDGFVKRYIKYINKRQYTDFLLPEIDISNTSLDCINDEANDSISSSESNILNSNNNTNNVNNNNNNTINQSYSVNNNNALVEKNNAEIVKVEDHINVLSRKSKLITNEYFSSKPKHGAFFFNNNTNNVSNQNITQNKSSMSLSNSNSMEDQTMSEFEKRDIKTNLSVAILYEVISCEFLHLNHYYKNFYYREFFQEKLIDLEDYINKYLYNDQSSNNEMSDSGKVLKAMNFYYTEIILRWKNLFEKQNGI